MARVKQTHRPTATTNHPSSTVRVRKPSRRERQEADLRQLAGARLDPVANAEFRRLMAECALSHSERRYEAIDALHALLGASQPDMWATFAEWMPGPTMTHWREKAKPLLQAMREALPDAAEHRGFLDRLHECIGSGSG